MSSEEKQKQYEKNKALYSSILRDLHLLSNNISEWGKSFEGQKSVAAALLRSLGTTMEGVLKELPDQHSYIDVLYSQPPAVEFWIPTQQINIQTKEGPRKTYTIPYSKNYIDSEKILLQIFEEVFCFSIPTLIYGLREHWYCGGFEKKLEFLFSEYEKNHKIIVMPSHTMVDRAVAILYSMESVGDVKLEITRIVGHKKGEYAVEVEGWSRNFYIKENRLLMTLQRKKLLDEWKRETFSEPENESSERETIEQEKETENSLESTEVLNNNTKNQGRLETPKKKRGRPRKDTIEGTQKKRKTPKEKETPKKRGRPRKIQTSIINSSSDEFTLKLKKLASTELPPVIDVPFL